MSNFNANSYDVAADGTNTLKIAVDNQGDLDNYVKKTGDFITGNVVIFGP